MIIVDRWASAYFIVSGKAAVTAAFCLLSENYDNVTIVFEKEEYPERVSARGLIYWQKKGGRNGF